MKIDVTNWKEFRFGDLISEIKKGKAHTKEDVEECLDKYNSIHFISRTEKNNGIDLNVINDNLLGIEKGNAITIGDTTATVFYQEEPFVCGDHMVVIRADWLNKYTGMFIVSLLKKEQYRYSYGRAFVMDLIENTILKLPAKENGAPDWQFMENYIKSLHHKPLTTKNKPTSRKLNVSTWKEFCLDSIFTIHKAYAYNQDTFEPCEKVGVHTINCITRTAINNGCDYKGLYSKDLKMESGCALTIGGEGIICFYQDEDFVCGTNMTVLKSDYLNVFNGLFIASVLNHYSHDKFSYGRAFNLDRVKTACIKLPILYNEDGTPHIDNEHKYSPDGYVPDWQFMEDYMKSLPYGDRLQAVAPNVSIQSTDASAGTIQCLPANQKAKLEKIYKQKQSKHYREGKKS